MKTNTFKMLSTEQLKDLQGGRRRHHSSVYHRGYSLGYRVGRDASKIGDIFGIASGLAGMFYQKKN